MRRKLTLLINGAEAQFDSVWDGRRGLTWPEQKALPANAPPTFCPECWHLLAPGAPCGYCAGISRAKRIRRLLSARRRGRRLRRRLLGVRGRCVDCGAKLPQGWEPRRCEGCVELCRCWAGMSQRRIAVGLCYVCGERPQTRNPNGRLSTRCERCFVA